MRCPGCNKFAPLDTEVEDIDLEFDSESGTITGSVRVVRRSQCCGEDMKEMTFEVEHETGLEDVKDADSIEVEHDDGEATESGGGRYAKNLVGFVVNVSLVKDGKKEPLWEGAIEDNAPASEYEEMC